MNDRNININDSINDIINDIDDLRDRLNALRQRVIRLKRAGRMKAGRRRKGPKKYPTILGRNINRLMSELGWSYDDLARVSGISKKRILDHVNKGTRPWPRVLKEYSETFSNAFGRPISVTDLLSEMRQI